MTRSAPKVKAPQALAAGPAYSDSGHRVVAGAQQKAVALIGDRFKANEKPG